MEANDEVGDVGFGLNVVDVLPLQPLPFLTFKEKHSATTLTRSGRTGATMMQQLGVGLDIINRYQNHVIPGSKPHEGMIMMISQKGIPVPIKDAIKEPAADEAFQRILTGRAGSVCTPFIGMGTPWTEQEQQELYAILNEYPPEPRWRHTTWSMKTSPEMVFRTPLSHYLSLPKRAQMQISSARRCSTLCSD